MDGTREEAGGVERWLERWVWLLDDAVRIPGTNIRFGLDPILGLLLPTLGDAVTGFSSLLVLLAGVKRGVPSRTLLAMLLNILIDVVLGSVPMLGDAFDFAWQANRRNLDLLESHRGPSTPAERSKNYFILAIGVLVVAGVMVGSAVLGVLAIEQLRVWLGWP
jgi:hypothetical protein